MRSSTVSDCSTSTCRRGSPRSTCCCSPRWSAVSCLAPATTTQRFGRARHELLRGCHASAPTRRRRSPSPQVRTTARNGPSHSPRVSSARPAIESSCTPGPGGAQSPPNVDTSAKPGTWSFMSRWSASSSPSPSADLSHTPANGWWWKGRRSSTPSATTPHSTRDVSWTAPASPPYSLRLNDFKVAYQLPGAPGAGQAGDFSANVTVRGDDTAKKQDLSVRVNAPLTLAGDRIYLLGNGYAPTLTVRNGRGGRRLPRLSTVPAARHEHDLARCHQSRRRDAGTTRIGRVLLPHAGHPSLRRVHVDLPGRDQPGPHHERVQRRSRHRRRHAPAPSTRSTPQASPNEQAGRPASKPSNSPPGTSADLPTGWERSPGRSPRRPRR